MKDGAEDAEEEEEADDEGEGENEEEQAKKRRIVVVARPVPPKGPLWVYMMSTDKTFNEKEHRKAKERAPSQRGLVAEFDTFDSDGIFTEIGIASDPLGRILQHNRVKPNGPAQTKYGADGWHLDALIGPMWKGAHELARAWQSESNGYIGRLRRWVRFAGDLEGVRLYYASSERFGRQLLKCAEKKTLATDAS